MIDDDAAADDETEWVVLTAEDEARVDKVAEVRGVVMATAHAGLLSPVAI